jgi:MFS family permease
MINMCFQIVCTVHVVPLKNRPQIQGLFGALFGISAVLGPLVGGAFTSNVTWRWCFYINLPVGCVAMVVIAAYLNIPARDTTKLSLAKKLVQLDVLGTALLIPGVVCLVLALQWGGTMYAVGYPHYHLDWLVY